MTYIVSSGALNSTHSLTRLTDGFNDLMMILDNGLLFGHPVYYPLFWPNNFIYDLGYNYQFRA